jgi:hypothetical protein
MANHETTTDGTSAASEFDQWIFVELGRFVASFLSRGQMAAAAAVLPHILLLLIDNWGHYNAGFYGNTEMVTPVLDELATTGVQISRLYTFKYCSPTRSAIFSGRDPTHVNVFNFGPQVLGIGFKS